MLQCFEEKDMSSCILLCFRALSFDPGEVSSSKSSFTTLKNSSLHRAGLGALQMAQRTLETKQYVCQKKKKSFFDRLAILHAHSGVLVCIMEEAGNNI